MTIQDVRGRVCGHVVSICPDPFMIQVATANNYCSSAQSCATKICESVDRKLLSYERCSGAPASTSLRRAILFGNANNMQKFASCECANSGDTYSNDGTNYFSYSKIKCTGCAQ